jgi:hypothetical protein
VRARLLADADLRIAIIRGLRRSEPQVDFLASQGRIPDSTSDPNVLALAATLGRVLVSHDFKTMPGHFYRFVESRNSPGVILIPQALTTGHAVEELRIAWLCNDTAEFENRIIYLPL